MTIEDKVLNAIKESLDKSISENITRYNSPIVKFCDEVVKAQEGMIKACIAHNLRKVLGSEDFSNSVEVAMKEKVARIIVSKVGGSIEKEVNELNKHPETQIRMRKGLLDLVNRISEK